MAPWRVVMNIGWLNGGHIIVPPATRVWLIDELAAISSVHLQHQE